MTTCPNGALRLSFVFAMLSSAVMIGCSSADVASGSDVSEATATAHERLGAFPTAGGASFGVWAPNAAKVFVVGDFNAWNATANELARGRDGVFSGTVPGAHTGQKYQFAIITPDASTLVRSDPRSFEVATDVGGKEPKSVIYDHGAFGWRSPAFEAPPTNEQVIYEMHVGTFVDTTGPGTGTWASATTKLPHLAKLGVNMIEVMPANEFPGDFGWGYNPTYPFAAANVYGSPDAMKAFVDAAHASGIGVVLDVVHNHYFKDSDATPSMSMWCFDGPCENGGVYFSADGTPWGPRPAYGVAGVHDFIVDSVLMWARDYRVDGFRWDSAIYTRRTDWNLSSGKDLEDGARLMKDVNAAVHALNPNAITIAEDLAGWDGITQPVDPSALGRYDSGFGFDSQWDDGFFYTLRGAVSARSDGDRDMGSLRSALSTRYGSSAMHRVVYTEDHDKVAPQNGEDKVRIPAVASPSDPTGMYAKKASTLAAGIALTTPGIPMLFMGQEIFETRPFPFERGKAMDWGGVDTFAGIGKLYADLVHLRRNASGTTRGLEGENLSVFHVNDADKVVAYHRWDRGGAGDDVVVVASFGHATFASYEIGMPRGGTWKVRFNGDAKAYDPAFGDAPTFDATAVAGKRDGLDWHASLALGAYALVVLSQDP